jgi:hypothetical protein
MVYKYTYECFELENLSLMDVDNQQISINKWVLSLATIWFKIDMIFFPSSLPNEHIFDLKKTCFPCIKSLKSICMNFCIPFDYSKNKVLKN